MSEPANTTPEAFLRSVRLDRKAAFRREIVPHFRYVFQSGFGLFVSAIFFTVLIWYVDFIKAVPDDWTPIWIGAALVALAAIRAPLRTYLRPADPVFLLALETRMADAYLWPALRGAMVSSIIRTTALYALYAPIYSRSPATASYAESRSLILLGLLFAILSGLNVLGGWMERKLALQSRRRVFRAVRWALTLLVAAALLFKPLLWAVPFMLLGAVATVAAYRLPAKHGFPWDRLIEEEASNRRRWLAFLSWFVDIPTETAKPAKRRWIAWAGELLPWKRRWAWHYLYAKVFLRGETFGALWRWTLLTGLVVAVSGNALADAIAFAVSIVVIGLQLSELKKVRFVETADALPIAPEDRPAAAAALAGTAGIAAVLLVAAIGFATAMIGVGAETSSAGYADRLRPEIWVSATAFGLLWCGWWMPSRIARYKDDDDL